MAVFLIFPALEAFAQNLHSLKLGSVEILFPPFLEQAARETLQTIPQIKQDLMKIFHWPFTPKPTIILMNDRLRFRQMSRHPLVTGFAVPKKDLVIIDHTRIGNPLEIEGVLKHELCHLFIHGHLAGVRIPRWFDEGIAQWVSNGVMDILHDPKQSLLPKAAFSNHMIPLGALNESFPRRENALRLAYEESRSFIDYLITTYGKSRLLEILALMKKGVSLRKAFIEILGKPRYKIEEQWRASLKQNVAWFAHLSYYLYDILFALAGLLVVYGFFRLWRKKKAYMEEASSTKRFG